MRTYNDFIQSNYYFNWVDYEFKKNCPFEYSMRKKHQDLLSLLDDRLYNWMEFVEEDDKKSFESGDVLSILHPLGFHRLSLTNFSFNLESYLESITKDFVNLHDEYIESLQKGIGFFGSFLGCNHVKEQYRIDFILGHEDLLTDEEYWSLLGETFCLTEFQSRRIDLWLDSFNRDRPQKHRLMSEEDWDFYGRLPDKIEIWRGCNDLDFIKGLSWSCDKKTSESFSNRFSSVFGGKFLGHGWIEKEKILMCSPFENLIVCNPVDIKDIEVIENN